MGRVLKGVGLTLLAIVVVVAISAAVAFTAGAAAVALGASLVTISNVMEFAFAGGIDIWGIKHSWARIFKRIQ